MNLRSLNLDRFAGTADAFIGRTLGGSMRNYMSANAARGAGPLTAHVAKSNPGLAMAMKHGSRAAAFGARAGLAGMGLGLSVAGAAAVGAAGLAYGAGRVYNAALNAPSFRPTDTLGRPYIDRGGSLMTWTKHGKIPYTNWRPYSPQLSSRVSDMIGGGAITAGIVGGIQDANQKRNWNVTQALSTGALEVERDNFMGATGSLTLSMYKQRYGKRSTKRNPLSDLEKRQIDQMGAVEYGAQYGAGDALGKLNQHELAYVIHLAHMAHGG